MKLEVEKLNLIQKEHEKESRKLKALTIEQKKEAIKLMDLDNKHDRERRGFKDRMVKPENGTFLRDIKAAKDKKKTHFLNNKRHTIDVK